jgi:hypothetical protein
VSWLVRELVSREVTETGDSSGLPEQRDRSSLKAATKQRPSED